jgi:AraC family transcriptional regulator of adaptative response / DNA-3-methyladenine glycosylase II
MMSENGQTTVLPSFTMHPMTQPITPGAPLGTERHNSTALDPEICERARLSRDPRFDGRFFIGVNTTGVYCRPVCPVKAPKRRNIDYFPSAAAAAEAGFRPCLRCRPELSAGTPDWSGAATRVDRALRLIADGTADEGGIEGLAERLGITSRHLHRLFVDQLGASPVTVLRTRRLHLAKRLIDGTDLRFADVAFAAGFGSVRRFNAAFRELYGRTPGELRHAAGRRARRGDDEAFVFRLDYRPELDWQRLLGFFELRATPGVEHVHDGVYRRSFHVAGQPGVLEAAAVADRPAIELRVRTAEPRALLAVVERARQLFDLGADLDPVHRHLKRDTELGPWVEQLRGVRVPGAWHGFELIIRAIAGQQVSVKGATTVTGRVAERCGEPLPAELAGGGIERLFPTPRALTEANLDGIGMPAKRVETMRRVATAILEGELVFDLSDPERLQRSLVAIPGIGDWTAQYVAMRLGEPDAFPASDLGLLKSAANGGASTPKQLKERAEAWRPWRAYAALLLWNANGEQP